MEAWQLAATPGTQHKALAGLEDVDGEGEDLDIARGPALESSTSEQDGPRPVPRAATAELHGPAVQRRRLHGLRQRQKKYISTWMDSIKGRP